MNIEYSNENIKILFEDLEDVSNSKNLLQKKIGLDLAKKSKRRLKEIKAADFFQKYLDNHIGNPHSLTGNFANCYGVDLSKNIRLIIKPIPTDLSAEALKVCKTTMIIGIVDYHGGKDEWLIS